MRLVVVFSLFLLLLPSCSKYPGFKKLTPELYYSLIQFGETQKSTGPGDYITVNLQYRTMHDSLFFSGKRKIRLNTPVDNASIDHCFLKLREGDCAVFLIPAEKFFNSTLKRSLPDFLRSGDLMKMNVRLTEIQTEKEFQKEKELFIMWSSELSEFENKILRQFLKAEMSDASLMPEGFYLLTLKEGSGKKPVKGDHIWVHYEGKFLNGKFFDGTYRSKEPIDFIYGSQFVLISGLDQALGYMSEGEKAIVILPSGLAFGERGDEFGLIPPYTSLIYTLELIKIE